MENPKPLHFLAEWRAFRGLTAEHFANNLDVNRTTLWRWETGQRKMDEATVRKICEQLQISPPSLLMHPRDHAKAQVQERFARWLDQVGVERATALLDGLIPPD